MKILETNFVMPVHCRIENDDGQITDNLFFVDNISEKVFDLQINLNKVENIDILSRFLNKDSLLYTEEKEIFLSDLVQQSIPTMEEIQQMVMEKNKSDNFEQETT